MIKILNNNFGSKKGFCNYVKFQVHLATGKYRELTDIDFASVKRFVFVCSGNICRSALAEAVVKKAGGNAVSFGLDTRGGDPADPRMVAFGEQHGYSLANHVTTRTETFIPCGGDLLVGMEPRHVVQLNNKYPEFQVTALGLWLPCKKLYLHDPYTGNPGFFNKMAKRIVLATNCLYAANRRNNHSI